MSLIEIQRQDEVSISLLQNNNFIIVQQDGKFFVDLNLLDLDNDNIPETVQDENIEIRNSMFSNKYLGVNFTGAEVPIKNNLWNGSGNIVSFHHMNDVKFFIIYENNLPIMLGMGDDLPPTINQSEFENLINYVFNSNDQKLQNLINNGTTDGFSLREEYVRLNNENGLLVDDSLTLFISFRYHLNKINEAYYKDLMNELLVNNFRPNLHTLRETDKFFIDGEIIGFVDLQNRDNKNYLISRILNFYSSSNLVLNYLNTTYNIDYSVQEQPTVITFNGIEINTIFQVESYNETFSAKYVLINDELAQNFISSNNNVMPSFLRYDGVKYVILFQSLQTGWFTLVRLQNDELETVHDLSTFNYMGRSIEMINYGTVNNINVNVPTIQDTRYKKEIFHKENSFYWAHTLDGSNNIVNIEIVSLTEVPQVIEQQPTTIQYNQPYSMDNNLRVIKQINRFGFADITFETGEDLAYYKKIVSPINVQSVNFTNPADYNDAYFSRYKNRQIFGLESNEAFVVDEYGTRVLEIIKINDLWYSLEKLQLYYNSFNGQSSYVSRLDPTKSYPLDEGEFVVIEQIASEDISWNNSITNDESLFNELIGHKVKPVKLVQGSGGGGAEWNGEVPPPPEEPAPPPPPPGDWSGSDASGPSGPSVLPTNESTTFIPGSIFRMYSGYKNKFFPYSVTTPWQHLGEKVVIMGKPQNTTWNVCWNIGIRSSLDKGTQFKLENYRNPKDSEHVILNFPKLKSGASQDDDIKFYVEKINDEQKWNIYIPGVDDVPLFTLEPKSGCTFNHIVRDGWVHNESHHTGPGVSESGVILARLNNGSIITSDLELYIACTGTNVNKTSLEVVFSRITLKANSQGPGLQMTWQPG